ncbi:MAG: helix-turn-helix transcriptional regulator [Deltaproteobacteria bacterium]|nr:helix-turn-helix transcriptional regulator [Deltaproteobacteria bacterium]
MSDSVFPALLRYWRGARGMSQLDLAGAADVSAKHISFLETGRAQPSRDMVLRLATTMGIPLRDQNAMLLAAGFAEAFVELPPSAFDANTTRALQTMMSHQEPYPLLVFDRHFEMVMANRATHRLLRTLLGDRAGAEPNVLKLLFDPTMLRPFIVQWDKVARTMLARVQRDALYRRKDEGLHQLLATLCAYEGVPQAWRTPDLEAPSDATLNVRFEFGGQRFGFLITLTVFQAPQNISLEELQIESYFPLDDATEALCRGLAAADP